MRVNNLRMHDFNALPCIRDWSSDNEMERLRKTIEDNRKVYFTHLEIELNLESIIKDFQCEDDSTGNFKFTPLTESEAGSLRNHSTLSKPLCFQIVHDLWTNTVLVSNEVEKSPTPELSVHCKIVDEEDSDREIVVFLRDRGIVCYLKSFLGHKDVFFFPYSLVDAYRCKIVDAERFAAIKELPPYLASALEYHGFRINDDRPRNIVKDDSMDTKWAFARGDETWEKYDINGHAFTSKYCDIWIWQTKFHPNKGTTSRFSGRQRRD